MGILRLPRPYDFRLSTERYRAYGPDLANLWHEDGLHRVVEEDEVRITATPSGVDVDPLTEDVERVVTRLLGLSFRLTAFMVWARHDPALDRVVARLSGFRPTLWVDPFEAIVDCITAQQVSLHAAFAIRRRLVQRFGRRARHAYAFPTPARLAEAEPADLVGLGFTQRKAEYVIALARSGLDLDGLRALSDGTVKARLMAVRGLGEWTADWFLARYLGRPAAWPATDLALVRALPLFYPRLGDVRSAGAHFQPFQNLSAQYLIHAYARSRRPSR
jgi:DNA-3-methyladenine glycosylase II